MYDNSLDAVQLAYEYRIFKANNSQRLQLLKYGIAAGKAHNSNKQNFHYQV